MRSNSVGVVALPQATYPGNAPFHPSEAYPEYPFPGHLSEEANHPYDAVRRLFLVLGLDKDNQGTASWNPLGRIVEPGMNVVLKPNFVLSRHPEGKELFSVITHPSILRAVADYCWIALRGRGRIVIADAPQYNCDFGELVASTGLAELIGFFGRFPGPSVELLDLRGYWSKSLHMPSCMRPLPGDPEGVVTVNLGRRSEYHGHPRPERFYGAVYHRHETIAHHSGDRQEYEISRTILGADVLISIPKMKVHKKVGVTLNAKGLVGMCTNKNYLVHYSLGTPDEGGDQFPEGVLTGRERRIIRFERWMYDNFLARRSVFFEGIHRLIYGLVYLRVLQPLGLKVPDEKRLLDAGNWHGNDSAWRMVCDLMKIIFFADGNGGLRDAPARRMFSIVDGVVGGDHKGPLSPDPKPAGVILGGENFLAVDIVATRLMGFDPMKLKKIRSLLHDGNFDFGLRSATDITVVSEGDSFSRCLSDPADRFFSFRPYPGWLGKIEI